MENKNQCIPGDWRRPTDCQQANGNAWHYEHRSGISRIKWQNGTLATKMTVLQLVDYYLQTQDTQLKLSTKQSHQIAREHMMRDLDFCNSKITDIKITDVKKFFMHLSDIGVPHSTLYIVKAIIFPAFRMAYEDQLISSNPCGFCFSNVISYKSKKNRH